MKKSELSFEVSPRPEHVSGDIFRASNSDISVIKFEGETVCIVNVFGEPWFVAKDICDALELSNPSRAISALDDDEVMTLSLTEGHSGKRGEARSWNMVAESGFYKLMARSKKATTTEKLACHTWLINCVFRYVRTFQEISLPNINLDQDTLNFINLSFS